MSTETQTWFSIHTYGKIKPTEILKATQAMVFLPNGRREKRITDWGGIFETPQEAKNWLIQRAKSKIAISEHQLARDREALKRAEAVEIPSVQTPLDNP